MRPYGVLMSLRQLFAIMIALALSLAPAFSRLGEAFAALPDGHHKQMVKGGHCQPPENAPNEGDKAPEKSCCLSMCMGVAVACPNRVQDNYPALVPAISAVRSLHLSYLGEIATPPPKFARDQTS